MKPIVPGQCKGRLLALDKYISFFGEVDPETGCLREEQVCFEGKVLAFRGSRGSTVGPYVLYALRKNSKNPVCMLVASVEPMLVVGCVLGEIPLYLVEDIDALLSVPSGTLVEVVGGELRVLQ